MGIFNFHENPDLDKHYHENGYYTEFIRSTEILKSGKQSKKYIQELIKFSPLFKCDVCHVLKGKKWVSHRNVGAWNWSRKVKRYLVPESFECQYVKSMLCMGCWNKIKAIRKKEDDVNECNYLIYRIKEELRKCQKLQQQEN